MKKETSIALVALTVILAIMGTFAISLIIFDGDRRALVKKEKSDCLKQYNYGRAVEYQNVVAGSLYWPMTDEQRLCYLSGVIAGRLKPDPNNE